MRGRVDIPGNPCDWSIAGTGESIKTALEWFGRSGTDYWKVVLGRVFWVHELWYAIEACSVVAHAIGSSNHGDELRSGSHPIPSPDSWDRPFNSISGIRSIFHQMNPLFHDSILSSASRIVSGCVAVSDIRRCLPTFQSCLFCSRLHG